MTYALKEKEKESEISKTEDPEQETDTTETTESETEILCLKCVSEKYDSSFSINEFMYGTKKRERGEHLCSLLIQRIMQSGLSVIWQ